MAVSTVGINDTTANAAKSALSGSSIMGKDDFLQLLVTQMKCQDPLNPMENSEFASQLAQYSQLESLNNINDNLESQIVVSQSMNNSFLTTLIGKDIKSLGDDITYEGKEVDGSFSLPRNASSCVVTIKSESGKTIREIDMGKKNSGDQAFTWDGKDKYGNKVDEGNYTFSVAASDSTGTITAETYSYGLASGLSYDQGTPYVVVNGNYVSMGDIISVNIHQTSSTNNGSSSSSNTSGNNN